MKEEKLLHAMDAIDDELIRAAMEAPERKLRRAWVKWVAAAACMCLLLASPVGAAMGESLVKFMNNGNLEFIMPDRLRLEDLTAEALAAFPDVEGQRNYICIDSLDDAEAYLGIDLPDNPVLEAAMRDELHWKTEDDEQLHSHCIITLSTGDKPEPYCVDAEAAYRLDGVPIQVMYRLPTEKNPYENGGGVSFETEKYDGTVYAAADGRRWDLYLREYDDGGFSAFALSKVNGTLTCVQAFNTSATADMTRETLEDLMKQIMDAFG